MFLMAFDDLQGLQKKAILFRPWMEGVGNNRILKEDNKYHHVLMNHVSFPSWDDPPMGGWKSKVFFTWKLGSDDGCRVIITHQKD